jgi:hypothetical protein
LNGSVGGEQERRYVAVFDGGAPAPPLAELARSLLAAQKEAWPALREGHEALAMARVRTLRCDGWGVQVQFNPRRIASSAAPLDAEFLRRRPCFLCLQNLPSPQQAVLYRDEWLVLGNPAPIFPGHLTIAHQRHLPQSLAGRFHFCLQLAEDFGPGMTVFYNGPQCGASAPDHLHLQAAPSGLMPVERELPAASGCGAGNGASDVTIRAVAGLGRGLLVIEGRDGGRVAAAAAKALAAIGEMTGAGGEPPLNLLCTSVEGGGWRLILFPRRRHRPAAYFREGADRLLISPGAVDLGGILITPREEDFLKLTPALVAGIYREVAFDGTAMDSLMARLG